MLKTKTALMFVISSVCGLAHGTENVIISEYIEGSDHNKAIELYNPTASAVDLSQYQLQFYFNGQVVAGSTISLDGQLAVGATYVVAHERASAEMLAVTDQVSSADFFNGNDAVVLSHQQQVIDSIGQVGMDPGEQWENGTFGTKNHTLRRSPTQLVADVIIDDPVTLDTWQGFPQDDVSDLGQFTPAVSPPNSSPDIPPIPPSVPPSSLTCGDSATAIHTLQGVAGASPFNGQSIVIEAIVTSNQEANLKGLFVQMPDEDADNNPASSEGVFVYTGNVPLGYNSGDRIRLQASVKEYQGLTELSSVQAHILCATQQTLPSATLVNLPIDQLTAFNAVEGMRVRFNTLFVNDVYNLGRYGELQLGSKRHFIGTQVAAPGQAALAVMADNDRDSIILDDGITSQNPDPILFPAPGLSASNTVRVGNSVTALQGVMHYGFNHYRVIPTAPVNFVAENPRPQGPSLAAGGNVIVASFNVLNYFNGDGQGGGFPTARGAKTAGEFARQRAKIVSAMIGINADIFGIMEIENDGFGETAAIANLVAGLNVEFTEPRYAYITPQVSHIGSDAITVGIIYRRDKVSPQGAARILTSANSPQDENQHPLFNDSKNRPMLTQAFTVADTQGSLVVAVNHFKSKGSSCSSLGDPDMNDGQGQCNRTRTRAAQAAAQWLAAEYPQQGVLLIGDLNAYAKEDPLTVLAENGWANLFTLFNKPNAYSYVYSGAAGQLDHALANEALRDNIVDVTTWHINADEPRALDYQMAFKTPEQQQLLYASDAYRSSDHDPVMVSLYLANIETMPVADFTYQLDANRVQLSLDRTVNDPGRGDSLNHERYHWDLGDGTIIEGDAEVAGTVTHSYAQTGDYQVVLTVTTSDNLSNSTTQTVSVTRVKQAPIARIYPIELWWVDVLISTSVDYDGHIQRQQWQIDGNTPVYGPMLIRRHDGQTHTAILTVTDNDGLTGSQRLEYD